MKVLRFILLLSVAYALSSEERLLRQIESDAQRMKSVERVVAKSAEDASEEDVVQVEGEVRDVEDAAQLEETVVTCTLDIDWERTKSDIGEEVLRLIQRDFMTRDDMKKTYESWFEANFDRQWEKAKSDCEPQRGEYDGRLEELKRLASEMNVTMKETKKKSKDNIGYLGSFHGLVAANFTIMFEKMAKGKMIWDRLDERVSTLVLTTIPGWMNQTKEKMSNVERDVKMIRSLS